MQKSCRAVAGDGDNAHGADGNGPRADATNCLYCPRNNNEQQRKA
jgi:hypothetical protein